MVPYNKAVAFSLLRCASTALAQRTEGVRECANGNAGECTCTPGFQLDLEAAVARSVLAVSLSGAEGKLVLVERLLS